MQTPQNVTLELVGCPECGAPAEVVDRFVLESTDCPVEHVTVVCARRHRFTMLSERLDSGRRHTAPFGEEPSRWKPATKSS